MFLEGAVGPEQACSSKEFGHSPPPPKPCLLYVWKEELVSRGTVLVVCTVIDRLGLCKLLIINLYAFLQNI